MRRTLLATVLLLAACSATPPAPEGSATDEPLSPAPSQLSARPSSSAAGEEVVNGWPDTTENEAGLYSWNGAGCGMSCNSGFMHNCYGACNLEIRIGMAATDAIGDDDGTAVTVAGHDGMYRSLDADNEEWIADMHGTTVAIHLTTERGTQQPHLDEAHAIIRSMYTEAADNRLGFRLVFRLTTDDWDSG